MKKIISLIIAAVIISGILPFTAFAELGQPEFDYPHYYESYDPITDLNDESGELRNYLIKEFAKFPDYLNYEAVDISSFKIINTQENRDALNTYIWRNIPELFQIYGLGSRGDYYIEIVYCSYRMEKEEYTAMFDECEKAADKLIKDLKNNDGLTQAEKALIVHDRLSVICEYDYEHTGNYANMYGALVEGDCVCEGYTQAYMYLLRKLGIGCRTVISTKLNHIWNIVKIDGVEYHTDVTWDDVSWNSSEKGIEGSVFHNNFLRSSDGIYEEGHTADDYEATPSDTKYDAYFWQNSNTAFQYVGGMLYYFDNVNAQLKKRVNGSDTVLADAAASWKAGEFSVWRGNYSVLCSDGKDLYYSTNDSVYKYSIKDGTVKRIYQIEPHGYDQIYGMYYENGVLTVEINDSPYGYPTDDLREEKIVLFVPGDVNGDGNVNNKDIIALFSYLSGSGNDVNTEALDINGDGAVNNKDIIHLFKYLSGDNVELSA